ncbi:hypothetical protein DEA8626_03087 [Defluviimonas aquaemixtae]|uniref:Cytochrome c domain-containing protein n=1 Tax=Albidovulum aquaemixtae TaxID=1542388 RepID=A0A2R8BKY5_9RHOB|nr:c-type cytochrome [Defluviimonas aquaemixtae]SPH24039.1 hypothetical protein DEA8626_03087 [Defluviimonas aquaemixtae]
MPVWVALVIIIALLALPAKADEQLEFTLEVAPEVAASGLMDYILPRFALKTGRRAVMVEDGADARLVSESGSGMHVIARGEAVYALILDTGNPAAERFADWLSSEIGQNTVAAFVPEDGPSFAPPPKTEAVVDIVLEGDAKLGRKVAETHCARCHRVSPEGTAMNIGSTPSFAALRSLPDWDARFAAFFTLNPHPAFLLVTGVSPPFDPARPPPIVPVEITPAEVDALGAYVARMAPADLGAEIISR